MSKYKYTQNWFLISEIKKLLLTFVEVDKVHHILEIGCFEGLSSVFFADNLLNHPDSTLTCVDPFLTIQNNDHAIYYLGNDQEKSFDYNISVCSNTRKINVNKETSDAFFLRNTREDYDFIYIDGCHLPDFVTRDMENSFKVLKSNGIMWMDDYGYNIEVKKAMDSFLTKHLDEFTLVHKGYQLAIRKK